MTRKDFQMLAETIAGASIDRSAREMLANDFAARLAQTNPRFNRARFISACGV